MTAIGHFISPQLLRACAAAAAGACAPRRARPASGSASSPSTSSTTTGSSRIPARPPATTSSAASSRSRCSSPRSRSTRGSAPGRAPRSRCSAASSAVLVGTEAVHYTSAGRLSGDDYTGLLSIPAGLLLVGRRQRHAVDVAPPRRRAAGGATRAGCSTSAALYVVASAVLMPTAIAYVVTHASRAHVPAAEPRRSVRGRRVQDERRAAAQGLVHPLEERRGRDLVPGPRVLPGAGAVPGRPRLRRPALRPPRRGRERRRPEPVRLAGRARHPRRRRRTCRAGPTSTRERIGGIGLSVGGEMMIEAAAESEDAEGDRVRGRQRPLGPRRASRTPAGLAGARRATRSRPRRRRSSPTTCRRPRSKSLVPKMSRRRVLHLRRERPAGRGAGQHGLLRGRPRPEGDLGGPGLRAHGRHEGAAGRVRAARRRLLRPPPALAAGVPVNASAHASSIRPPLNMRPDAAGNRARSGCSPDVGVDAARQAGSMPSYLLQHRHEPQRVRRRLRRVQGPREPAPPPGHPRLLRLGGPCDLVDGRRRDRGRRPSRCCRSTSPRAPPRPESSEVPIP